MKITYRASCKVRVNNACPYEIVAPYMPSPEAAVSAIEKRQREIKLSERNVEFDIIVVQTRTR